MKSLVAVVPNSKVEGVTREEGRLVVRVKEPPRDGKANRAVIRLLAVHFKVLQGHVKILRGQGSRYKLVEILGK